ncbi:MAG: hypothetical protein AVDCRST_MAG08-1506, partial [uncultured Acetobacteraceae bacterium]
AEPPPAARRLRRPALPGVRRGGRARALPEQAPAGLVPVPHRRIRGHRRVRRRLAARRPGAGLPHFAAGGDRVLDARQLPADGRGDPGAERAGGEHRPPPCAVRHRHGREHGRAEPDVRPDHRQDAAEPPRRGDRAGAHRLGLRHPRALRPHLGPGGRQEPARLPERARGAQRGRPALLDGRRQQARAGVHGGVHRRRQEEPRALPGPHGHGARRAGGGARHHGHGRAGAHDRPPRLRHQLGERDGGEHRRPRAPPSAAAAEAAVGIRLRHRPQAIRAVAQPDAGPLRHRPDGDAVLPLPLARPRPRGARGRRLRVAPRADEPDRARL